MYKSVEQSSKFTHLHQSYRKRALSTSCNDYLRFEYAALEEIPTLLNLPFELLDRILDEVRAACILSCCIR